MPQLDASEFSRVSQIIDELAPLAEEGSLYEAANNFVNDQVERKKQYGERMFISPKQIAWLERLHEENVGNAVYQEPRGVDERIRHLHDPQGAPDPMDDDIPF